MNAQQSGWGLGVVAVVGCLVVAMFAAAAAAETLSDILLEKGILTKEDWLRIQRADEPRDAAAEPTGEQTSTSDAMMMAIIEQRDDAARRRTAQDAPPVTIDWGTRGFSLATGDGLFKTTLQWRFQGRWTYPERTDPRKPGDFSDVDDGAESSFELRRVRMKVGGHGYRPWITYFVEIDLQAGRKASDASVNAPTRLFDWRISLEKYPWAKLRLGQWKIDYNRERADSSGKQTFVERSIVNRVFTIDRQIGAMLYGRLNPGGMADVNYYAGVWSGGGRGLAHNDDAHMMYMGRLQWNVFGRALAWQQSDTTFHSKPTASVSVAGYTTIGRCTRWSSEGCGHLDVLDASDVAAGQDGLAKPADADAGQFRVEGVQVGTAFKYHGFAWQHEHHWKRIKDAGNAGRRSHLFGGYVQAGYFPHYLTPVVPAPLELAVRYAYVDSEIAAAADDVRQEFTGALNWFFAGHRNKVTVDTSYLTLNRATAGRFSEQRVRLQWDVSF